MALKRQHDMMAMFSMASMTDVIFLLLIFFMITSTFVFPTALEVNLPQSTIGIEGGIRTPREPALAVREAEKSLSYPFSTIGGIIIAPTAATVPGEDPEIAAKKAQAKTVMIPNPPWIFPTRLAAKFTSRLDSPPVSIR